MSIFGTKGRTLQMLEHKLCHAKILPIYLFNVDEWGSKKSDIIKKIPNTLGYGPWIVRSSFSQEDKSDISNAGEFVSVLDVGNEELEEAVNNVIASYTNGKLTEEIFIQPMLENVELVGVAFSHDPNTGAPDMIINWSKGSNTQAVTAGLASNVWQLAPGGSTDGNQTLLKPVIKLVKELLSLFDDTPIDCEFAITKEKKVRTLWLLQVRRLVLVSTPVVVSKHLEHLDAIQEKIRTGIKAKPFLIGKSTVYGVMPDWNPAEIIGRRPRPLAMSLYKELITDSIWAYQRHNYGYRNLRSYPLMLSLSGVPYIDVRVSFNSFIPSDLDDEIASKLMDYYLNKLISQPRLHDKVEFEIVFSCYTFDLRSNLKNLRHCGFSKNDQDNIAESLLNLTNKILNQENGLWRIDAKKLDILKSKFKAVKSSSLTPIEKIYWYLEDCKRYGTLPFAGLARAAFIGVQMLRSLVNLNVFSEENYRDFMESVSTVSSQMTFEQKTTDKDDFLEKYGHLRPGTYDILSKRYDANPELYFDWNEQSEAPSPSKRKFAITDKQKVIIDEMLKLNKIQTNSENLLDFIRKAIELREKAKFDFTRNLSETMLLIENVGAENDLNVEDLSFCNISAFRELYFSSENTKNILTEEISKGKRNYKKTLGVSLPPLITKPEDIMSFMWPQTDPNFITQKKVTAPITTLIKKDTIAEKIVCFPNADPGYDWIFSYPIAGFITAWGGANSHMAIRASEQEVPAVIGAGEVLFNRWTSSKCLTLNCAEKRVEIMR